MLGQSASGSGLALIAFVVAASLGSMTAGRLISRLTHYKRVPIVGLPLSILVLIVLAIEPAGHSLAGISALLALGGVGLGTMYPMTTVVIQNAVEPHRLGIATGTLNFFRQLGGAIIVAAFAAIVLGGIDAGERGLTLAMRSGAFGSAADFAILFRFVFLAAAAFLALALLAIALIEERPLRGPALQPMAPPAPSAPVAAE